MGALTRLQLVTQGLALAGDASLSSLAPTWLNAWLRKEYSAWPWPFLQRKQVGLALAAAATSVSFGNGATVTPEVLRIFDPVQVYTSDYRTRGQARVVSFVEQNPDLDESANDPATNIGLPTRIRVAPDSTLFGKYALKPWPIPDRAYLLNFSYWELPVALASDASVPVYPNDSTMLQAIVAQSYLHQQKNDEFGQAMEILAAMVMNDRAHFGQNNGINDTLGLDTSIFR